MKTFTDRDYYDEFECEQQRALAEVSRLTDIIHRASIAFHADGPDGIIASNMLKILDEVRDVK